METIDKQIYEVVEVAAAEYPWDAIDFSIKRAPQGTYRFGFYLPDNEELGAKFVFSWGESPQKALEDLRNQAGERNPEKARLKKIAELELQLAKLRSVSVPLLPPYRAPGQLGFGDAPQVPAPRAEFINIETTKGEV